MNLKKQIRARREARRDTSVSIDSPLKLQSVNSPFFAEIEQRSHEKVGKCLHCRSCVAGCPLCSLMDYPPNVILRMVRFGMRKEVLTSSTIWICASCHTCSSQCPQGIDIPAVMDALRHTALEENVSIAQPNILNFHKDVLHTIKRYGRTHKLEIMLRYKARNWDWLSDTGVGLKLFTKGKLELMPSRMQNKDVLKQMFADTRKEHGND